MCIYVERGSGDGFILRNWLMQLWRLASPKFAGYTSRLETEERTDVEAQVQRQSGGRILPSSREVSLFSI